MIELLKVGFGEFWYFDNFSVPQKTHFEKGQIRNARKGRISPIFFLPIFYTYRHMKITGAEKSMIKLLTGSTLMTTQDTLMSYMDTL